LLAPAADPSLPGSSGASAAGSNPPSSPPPISHQPHPRCQTWLNSPPPPPRRTASASPAVPPTPRVHLTVGNRPVYRGNRSGSVAKKLGYRSLTKPSKPLFLFYRCGFAGFENRYGSGFLKPCPHPTTTIGLIAAPEPPSKSGSHGRSPTPQISNRPELWATGALAVEAGGWGQGRAGRTRRRRRS
jgi:hypothetical protein